MKRPVAPLSLRRAFTALVLTSVEAFLSILCIFSSIPILISRKAAPGSVVELLPGWTLYVWALGLLLGGCISLAGILTNEYRLERIGVLFLISTVGVFAVVLLGSLPQATVGVITFGLFTLSMIARYWVLGQLLTMQKARMLIIMERQKGVDHE